MYSFGETDLPGLADLRRVRVPAGVDDRARRADGAAERGGELLEQREPLRRAEPAPARDDDVRVLDRRSARLLLRLLDERRERREVRERRLEATRPRPRRPTRPGRARPTRTIPSLGPPFQPTSTSTVSPSAGRVPTSSPSVDRQVGEIPVQPRVEARREPGRRRRPRAPRRRTGRRPAPVCSTSVASASTRGCGSGAASSRRLARVDLRGAEGTRAGGHRRRALAEHDADGVAERRRLREHAEPALLERAAVVLEEHEELHRSFLSTTRSRTFCAAEPSSSIFTWSPRDGGGAELEDGRLRAGLARRARVHADVGERQRLLRLRLRAHDPLERRVARLVDRVRDGDDGGERRA